MKHVIKTTVRGIELTIISNKKLTDGDITRVSEGNPILVAHTEPVKNKYTTEKNIFS